MKMSIRIQRASDGLIVALGMAIAMMAPAAYGGPGGPGACCIDGVCDQRTEGDCTAAGGEYFGDGSACNPFICEPIGACCTLKGCIVVPQFICEDSLDGFFLGDDTTCNPGACDPDPTGACCLNGIAGEVGCAQLTADECGAAGGVYQGDETSCTEPGICGPPTGACCFPSSCIDASESDCAILFGDYQGDGTTCATTSCPLPGACCMPNGGCIDTNQGFCDSAGGAFQGEGSSCGTPGICPPVGACCIEGKGVIFCETLTEDACDNAGGTYQGDGTSCDVQEPCVPTGACCIREGEIGCIERTESQCTGLGGDYQGDGTTCATPGICGPGEERVDSEQKGSLLIFPKVEVRWSTGPLAGVDVIQDTFIDIANDFPADVRVQMYFVNGDPRLTSFGGILLEPGWNNVDNLITLTANEPTYWSAATGLPKGVSPWSVLDPGGPPTGLPGRVDPENPTQRMLRGFIIAFAVDELGQEIRWNHLKGDACIVNYPLSAAWEYNAYAFPVVDPTIANGQQTGTPGVINMDGFEYARGFDQLLLDFYAVGSAALSGPSTLVTVNTDLTLHPVDADLRQETNGPVTTKASFDIWNMNEVKFSGTDRCITCWDQTLLSSYGLPNHFFLVNLQTDKGRARIDGLQSILCPGSDGDGIAGVIGIIGSRNASLLGVQAKIAVFDGGAGVDFAGGNLHGSGHQSATIRFDFNSNPPSEAAARKVNAPKRKRRQ